MGSFTSAGSLSSLPCAPRESCTKPDVCRVGGLQRRTPHHSAPSAQLRAPLLTDLQTSLHRVPKPSFEPTGRHRCFFLRSVVGVTNAHVTRPAPLPRTHARFTPPHRKPSSPKRYGTGAPPVCMPLGTSLPLPAWACLKTLATPLLICIGA